MNNILRRKRIYALAAIVLAAMLLCCIGGYFFNTTDRSADALISSSPTVKVEELLMEGYENEEAGSNSIFNAETLADLYQKLSGVEGADIDTIKGLGTKDASFFRSKNTNNDIRVVFAGKEWTATYLTQAGGNVVLTLWLADNESGTTKWNDNYDSGSNSTNFPSNMYGISKIRSVDLNNGGTYWQSKSAASAAGPTDAQKNAHAYAKFTMPKSSANKASVRDFLLTPAQAVYQGDGANENSKFSSNSYVSGYTVSNDCFNTISSGANWYNNGAFNYESKPRYSDWKNDYLWLPSVSEVGDGNGVNGLWKVSTEQKKSSAVSWLRSARYFYALCVRSDYRRRPEHYRCPYTRAVRPALHLNLTSAAQCAAPTGLEAPSPVKTDYNGAAQTLADVSADQKSWYDPQKIDLSYPQEMKDAGTYKVTATIKTELAQEGLTFKGEPSTGETATSRIFTFTINKRKIGVNATLNTSNVPVAELKTGALVGTDSTDNGRAPVLGFLYESSDGGGYSSTQYPTAVGSYTAKVQITNECNYELDGEYTVPFRIDKRDIIKPAIAGQSRVEYNGALQEFTVSGVSGDVTITPQGDLQYADGKLKAKNAGKYTATVALKDGGVATQWSGGGSSTFDLEIEITKAPLTMQTSCDADNWTWQAGQSAVITIIGNSHIDDETELYIYYTDGKTSQKYDYINGPDYKVVEGKKRTITMPTSMAVGSYSLHIELFGSNKDNDNYTLTPITMQFNIVGKPSEFSENDIIWRSNGTVIADKTNAQFTYTGNPYRFDIDDSGLRAKGVKIKDIGGYDGDTTATNAKSDNYTVRVHIVNYDDTYAPFSGVYTLNYKINKAKFDLNGLSWNYTQPFQFKAATKQEVKLQGSLPTGLTVSYSNNGQIPVGEYTATVSFKTSDPNNYIVPTSLDRDSYIYDDGEGGAFPFTLAWEIRRAVLDLNGYWKEDLSGADTYKLPWLTSIGGINVDEMVTYKYYDYTGDVKGDEISIGDINVNEEKRYLAEATLKDSHTGNYELRNNTYPFTVGTNKYPVKLSIDIDGAKIPYTGNAVSPNITIQSESGLQLNNIKLTYYKDGSTEGSDTPPSAVGKYTVRASLIFGMDDNYLTDDSLEFEFEIVNAEFDVSNLEWKYTHTDKDGNEITAVYDFSQGKWINSAGEEVTFVYDKNAHVFELVGKDDIAGLEINYKVGGVQTSSISMTDADTYDIALDFVYDEDNFAAPEFAQSLNVVVRKAVLDTSNVAWGYKMGYDENLLPYEQPLVYTRTEGGAAEFTLALMNLPEELNGAIVYSGDRSASDAGTYTVEYTLNFTDSNYETVTMPSGLQSSLRWEIKTRVIVKPEFDGSWTVFDNQEHDFGQIFGIEDENWYYYVNMTVKLGDSDLQGYKGKDAGRYRVIFVLKEPGPNNKNINWVEWPDPFYLITVSAIEIEITEWQGEGRNAKAIYDEALYGEYLEYKYFDGEGKETDVGSLKYNVEYFKTLCVKAEFEGNVVFTQDSVLKQAFSLSDGRILTHKPTFTTTEVTYNGKDRTLKEFGIDGLEDYMQVDMPKINGAGEYTVKISFKEHGVYCWEDGTDTEVEYTVKVNKMQLPPAWDTSSGKPVYAVPEEVKDLVQFDYTYYDAQGKPVAENKLKKGETYKVVASLKVDYRNNFEFIDEEGEVVTEADGSVSSKSEAMDFVLESNGGGLGNVVDFEKVAAALREWWQVIASVAGLILIIVFTAKGAGYASKRKQAKKTIENKYKTFYATGLFGLSMTNWDIIAGVILGCAVLSFVFMLVEKKKYAKVYEQLDEAKDEYNKMMLMHMMGGNNASMNGMGQGMNSGMGMNIGIEEIRGIISDTVTAMLPNIQQYLPQTASGNEEVIQTLIEKTGELFESQDAIMQKLSEKSDSANDEILESIVQTQEAIMQKLESDEGNEEIIKNINETQEAILEKLRSDNSNEELMRSIGESQEAILNKLAEQSVGGNEDIIESINRTQEAILQKLESDGSSEEIIKNINETQEAILEKLRSDNSNEELMRSIGESQEAILNKLAEQSVGGNEDIIESINRTQETILHKLAEQPDNSEELIKTIREGNDETIKQFSKHNDEVIMKLVDRTDGTDEMLRKLLESQQTFMQKLAEQPVNQSGKEAAVATLNEKSLDELKTMIEQMNAANSAAGNSVDNEVIRNLVEGQRMKMQKLSEQPTEKIIEREVASANANDEAIRELKDMLAQLNGNNDEIIKSLVEGQRMIMQRLAEQPVERASARQIEAANANDEIIRSLVEGQRVIMQKLVEQPIGSKSTIRETAVNNAGDETIRQLMRNQDVLMHKVIELSADRIAESRQSEKINAAPVERVVEKIVEVPVEREVAATVVPIPVAKKSAPVREPVKRLTLDEAYENLSAKQKKFFDTLREYAMRNDKCKEKKSTYYTLLGQSSVNPLVKLTIKKGTTVALFKMEDEYFKDIRRNAGSDGTKMKVKETELIVGDAQALATAKEMIDLRADQIDRYQEYLKEQRSLKK